MCERDVERCPTLADMERASDGELSSPAERDAFDAHLRRCPACRDRMQGYASFTRRIGQTLTGDDESRRTRPRRTRAMRSARFAEALHSRKQAHIHRRTASRPLMRWLSVAAVAPLLAIGILFSRTNTVVVHADELLTRAVTFERARPVGSMQRVRIRLMPAYDRSGLGARTDTREATRAGDTRYAPFLVVRELTNGVGADAWPSIASANGDTVSVTRLLAQHRLDWRTPLSIEAVRAWRDGLGQKRDHVTPHGRRELLLRTTTMEGLLREVQVTVRRETFHVTRQLLVFDGIGRIEIEEIAEWVRPQPATVLASAAAAPAAVALPELDALQRAELDARLVLRDAGADLGGDVRVSSGADAVRVEGRIGSAALRRALSAQLSAVPLVRVALSAAAPAAAEAGSPEFGATTSDASASGAPAFGAVSSGATSSEAVPSGAAARPALGRWLNRTFGEEPSEAKRTFVPRLEGLIHTVTLRLTALDALSSRYADAGAAPLSPAARAKLQRLLDLHYRALNTDLHALDARVAVLFGSTARPEPAEIAPADWARRVDAGLVHARALDRLLDTLLTRDDLLADERQPDGPRALSREFSALWEAVNARTSPAPRSE